jgi:hypothetical protein
VKKEGMKNGLGKSASQMASKVRIATHDVPEHNNY